jgi:hypothetical protein
MRAAEAVEAEQDGLGGVVSMVTGAAVIFSGGLAFPAGA